MIEDERGRTNPEDATARAKDWLSHVSLEDSTTTEGLKTACN